jgi:uroporphyrinogen-III synthase
MTNPAAGGVSAGALSGARVLVPRPAGRASDLVDELERAGAVVTAVPLISIAPPLDSGALDLAVLALAAGDFTWVAFTSVNAVRSVVGRAAALALDPVVTADTRVAAVGPTTAQALRDSGIPVDLVPSGGGSSAALAAVWPRPHAGESVLLPRSDLAAETLPDSLAAAGYLVNAVTAYRTVVEPVPPDFADRLSSGGFDAVLLTSPSIVAALNGVRVSGGTIVGAIGQPTTAAAQTAGLSVSFTAPRPTAAGLAEGLIQARHEHHHPQEK